MMMQLGKRMSGGAWHRRLVRVITGTLNTRQTFVFAVGILVGLAIWLFPPWERHQVLVWDNFEALDGSKGGSAVITTDVGRACLFTPPRSRWGEQVRIDLRRLMVEQAVAALVFALITSLLRSRTDLHVSPIIGLVRERVAFLVRLLIVPPASLMLVYLALATTKVLWSFLVHVGS